MADQIVIPRLVGTRDAAARLVQEADLPSDFNSAPVYLQARALVTSTISFTDELVSQLASRRVGSIVLMAGTKDFKRQLRESSSRRGGLVVRSMDAAGALSA